MDYRNKCVYFVKQEIEKTPESKVDKCMHGDASLRSKSNNFYSSDFSESLFYDTDNIDAISSLSDTDEMDLVNNGQAQKYKWPLMKTTDQVRLKKEKSLHTLMTEIDDLMEEVGIANKKYNSTGITYEVLMSGSSEISKKKERDQKKKKFDQASCSKFKGAKSVKKPVSQSDKFVEELDNLLNECDDVK